MILQDREIWFFVQCLRLIVFSNLVSFKTYNAEFDKIIIKFVDQSDRPLELEDKFNSTLLARMLIEPRTRKYVKGHGFL